LTLKLLREKSHHSVRHLKPQYVSENQGLVRNTYWLLISNQICKCTKVENRPFIKYIDTIESTMGV